MGDETRDGMIDEKELARILEARLGSDMATNVMVRQMMDVADIDHDMTCSRSELKLVLGRYMETHGGKSYSRLNSGLTGGSNPGSYSSLNSGLTGSTNPSTCANPQRARTVSVRSNVSRAVVQVKSDKSRGSLHSRVSRHSRQSRHSFRNSSKEATRASVHSRKCLQLSL